MRVSADPALAELQRLRPAKLRVYVRDSDEPKAVAIPATRKKWERLATTLEGLDWTRIEALDPRGNITGVVAREDDSAATAPSDAELELADAERVEPLLALMLKAQTVALASSERQMKPLLDGMTKLVGVVTDALGAVAGAYRMALAAASTVPTGGGGRDDGGADVSLMNFLQVAMMMATKGGGAPAALGAVKVASEVARDRPKSQGSAPTGQPPASGVGPGR